MSRNPDYPTAWIPMVETRRGVHVGAILRLTSPNSDEIRRCKHRHQSRADAKGCAELASSMRNHPTYRSLPDGSDPPSGGHYPAALYQPLKAAPEPRSA